VSPAWPRRWTALASSSLLLPSCADGAAAALRTGAALALLAGVLALVRIRRPRGDARRPLSVEDREPLGRDSGVALVRAGGERVLVGWGREGVRMVARLRGDEGRS
jgi:hypothetical protein